jgi:hypothetical protein
VGVVILILAFFPAGRGRGTIIGGTIVLWALATAIYGHIMEDDPTDLAVLHFLLWGALGAGLMLYFQLRPGAK